MDQSEKRRKNRILLAVVLLLLAGFVVPTIWSKYTRSKLSEPKEEHKSTVKELIEAVPTKTESVCLDPGHGGNDIGASYNSIIESKINLIVAQEVATNLVAAGYKVYFTRTDDEFIYKRDRAAYCNSVKADILVAIHHNSYKTDRSVDYATTLYYKEIDKKLASSVQSSIASTLQIKDQGISKFNNSELWVAEMPAVMAEAFFITNTTESKSLAKDNSRLISEAKAISDGIINYFTNPDAITDSTSADSLIIDRADLGD
ncbi:MAG: N-acetylmuramoyl-L-alanine amidase [Patescibacteria group bacterium]|jgi:N-acetylmuramoyl-L-alanine amidase